MMKKVLLLIGLLMTMTFIVGCTSNTPEVEEQTFTLAELANFDGQNGRQAYVAVDGVVYDVTNASNWSNGSHNGQRLAGTDASAVILSSPHGKSVLTGLPVVGTLVNE